MHYLGLALYAEGRTDYYFLCPLLQRLCEDICAQEANQLVEISDKDMGLPTTAKALESEADPKATLNAAFSLTMPSGRRRRQGISPLLNGVGEQASLQRLRKLAAFSSMEAELRQALKTLRILPSDI